MCLVSQFVRQTVVVVVVAAAADVVVVVVVVTAVAAATIVGPCCQSHRARDRILVTTGQLKGRLCSAAVTSTSAKV
jgi:hypothetical protein